MYTINVRFVYYNTRKNTSHIQAQLDYSIHCKSRNIDDKVFFYYYFLFELSSRSSSGSSINSIFTHFLFTFFQYSGNIIHLFSHACSRLALLLALFMPTINFESSKETVRILLLLSSSLADMDAVVAIVERKLRRIAVRFLVVVYTLSNNNLLSSLLRKHIITLSLACVHSIIKSTATTKTTIEIVVKIYYFD